MSYRPGGLVYSSKGGKLSTLVRVAISTGVEGAPANSQLVTCDSVIGPFAVHRPPREYAERGRNWQVTHIRSGRLLRAVRTRALAREIAEALVPLGNWNKPAARLPKTLRNSARETIDRILTRDAAVTPRVRTAA